ncbi:small leucine-rich protein 1 isoform X2 [Anas platyrhynchos]|uniref:small leucine-rich protein 1 isoform X2 n=1 Tax=Anas platyrhynchos TaxID=8839 RepID=UPI003AF26031
MKLTAAMPHNSWLLSVPLCAFEAKTEQNRKRRWATDPKVDKELAMLHDPRNTLLDYRTERQKLGRSGKKVNKCRN